MPDLTFKSNAEFIARLLEVRDNLAVTKTNKEEEIFNIPAAFDIETTSFYNNRDQKTAIMYEWSFGIGFFDNGEFEMLTTYGRNWDTFSTLLWVIQSALGLHEKRRLIVYVHNLPYEWQFMRKHFSWTKVFFLDDRKPVYCINDMGIEFRCSLKLSGKSLANTAKDLVKYKTEKMVGDLDYSLIRHEMTPLTRTELIYCEQDVKVILAYIQEKIETDGDITRIPLTKTGYVRRYCKKACFPELEESEDAYEELEADTGGVQRAERMFSRRIYPRKCAPSRADTHERWFVRLYELLSGRNGGV